MKTSFRIASAALAVAVAAAANAGTEPHKLEDLVRNPKVSSARISPNGEFLAVTAPREGDQTVLIVMRTDDLKVVNINQLPDGQGIGPFTWVGPKRLMFGATKEIPTLGERPAGTGEWYAVDADGEKPRTIISYSTKDATQRGKAVSVASFYQLLDPMIEDDSKVLMEVSYATSKDGALSELVEVDTYSARRRTVVRGPDLNCSFALDKQDRQARYATCIRELDGTRTAATLYAREGGEWKKMYDSEATGMRYRIADVTADGRVLAYFDDGKKPAELGWFEPSTITFKSVFRDPNVDAGALVYATDDKTPIGVSSQPDYPSIALFDREHADAQLYKSLLQAFPGQFVVFGSATSDGNKLVVATYSDRDPASFYLYDRASGKARFLLKAMDWLDESRLAEMRPIELTARDGVKLRGYLTIPAGVGEPKNLPLIINPHGGPHGVRDDWGFSPDTQILASRGYLVLQVNYRGSGGYGEGFIELGFRKWHTTMQDDLTDAVNWAVEQGYADRDRVCIYGGSYGGYAALMSVVREPDLYRCAAGNVGVYDMRMMFKKGDVRERESGIAYMQKVLGTEPAELDARSPTKFAHKIKASVFLSAGKTDERAPEEHTHAMYEALKAAGNPVRDEDYILQSKEGHGFYNEKNKLNYYTRLLAFFDRNLAPRATTGGTAAAGSGE